MGDICSTKLPSEAVGFILRSLRSSSRCSVNLLSYELRIRRLSAPEFVLWASRHAETGSHLSLSSPPVL